jgi:hypothetical protein
MVQICAKCDKNNNKPCAAIFYATGNSLRHLTYDAERENPSESFVTSRRPQLCFFTFPIRVRGEAIV